MKAYIILILTIFCVSCGSSGSDTSEQNNNQIIGKISNWQARQQQIQDNISFKTQELTGDLYKDISWIEGRTPYIGYKSDENGDYWKVTQETINDGYGDCEDSANLMLVILSNSELINYYNATVFCRWLKFYGDADSHMVCIIQAENGQTVYISNMVIIDGLPEDYDFICDYDLYTIYLDGINL